MRRLLLLASLSLTGCLVAAHPAETNAPPPAGTTTTTTTTVTHEPTEQHHPPPLPTPPTPPPQPQRLMTCDDATRSAMQYATEHQMGPMELKDCKVEEDGRVLRVSLKSPKGEKHEHHDKNQLRMKFDARDGHVLEVKDHEKDDDDHDHDEHGKGHGKGHDKD